MPFPRRAGKDAGFGQGRDKTDYKVSEKGVELALKIVVGTRNRGKIKEIRRILSGAGIEMSALEDFPPFPEPEENGKSFFENALIKAKAAYKATGLPALADDSGIEVDALDGRPGIGSARYGGAGASDSDRSKLLLEELREKKGTERRARFRCVMVLYPAPGTEEKILMTEGVLEGMIAGEPAGNNGFGYDPVFYLPEEGLTVAQMDPDRKNRISHRYRALIEMRGLIEFGGFEGDKKA